MGGVLALLICYAALFVVSGVVAWLISLGIGRIFRKSPVRVGRKLRVSMTIVIATAATMSFEPLFRLPEGTSYTAHKTLFVLLVLAIMYFVIRATTLAKLVLFERFNVDQKDNLHQRKMRTQIGFIEKVIDVFVFLIAASIILLSFDSVQNIGKGLLASAGVAGLVIGLAAQKLLGNLLAGIQIVLTQPIRMDDVVIVEGEFGWIEEITLTYVVVKVWDDRRVILPISFFIDNPFQNWTRNNSALLGPVMIYVDHSAPIDDLRTELTRIANASKYFDGRLAMIQVTDTRERCIELRILLSGPDAPTLWDFRCEVREKLITYIQQNHPSALPRVRAEDITGPERVGALSPG